MVYFALSLIGLFGIACLFVIFPDRTPDPATKGDPAADWPDIPVDALGLFQPTGRINHRRPREDAPVRVASFEAAQHRLLEQVKPSILGPPQIALRLSAGDDAWTDVLLNGALIVQVPTLALVTHQARTARAA